MGLGRSHRYRDQAPQLCSNLCPEEKSGGNAAMKPWESWASRSDPALSQEASPGVTSPSSCQGQPCQPPIPREVGFGHLRVS